MPRHDHGASERLRQPGWYRCSVGWEDRPCSGCCGMMLATTALSARMAAMIIRSSQTEWTKVASTMSAEIRILPRTFLARTGWGTKFYFDLEYGLLALDEASG